MKNLMGAPSDNTNEMQGLANKCTEGDMTQLVNSMNDLWVTAAYVMSTWGKTQAVTP